MKEILDQIASDLAELQNRGDLDREDALNLFYDRMCANVTDYEDLQSKEVYQIVLEDGQWRTVYPSAEADKAAKWETIEGAIIAMTVEDGVPLEKIQVILSE